MKHEKVVSWMRLGLALAGLAGTALADTTNTIAFTTFEPDARPSWGYGYFYGNNSLGSYQNPDRAYYDPLDLDQTNGMCMYAFDNTGLEGNENYGTGFGGPQVWSLDTTLFVSSNREDYVFSFYAKAEGLAPGQTTANCEMQVQFFNTAQTPNKILQVNLPFKAGTNMTYVVASLGDGSLADSSDATFAAGYQGITSLQFNVNTHAPNTAFGNDGDNVIIVDDLKLEVIQKPATNVQPPTYTATIVDWNFDDKPLLYDYGSSAGVCYTWSENASQPAMTYSVTDGHGKDGGNGWILRLDNTALEATPPAWAGGGSGGGGPANYTLFDTGDLSAYRISFDARVEGLAEGRANTTCALQLFIEAPDDTLQPADANTDGDLLARMDFPVAGLTTEWQPYSFLLSRGSAGSGSKANITAHYNVINAVRTQWQIENAASAADWGYDTNNAFIIDNFKIERVYTGLAPLVISTDGKLVSWTAATSGTTKLQSAANLSGPWNDVPNATSPYTVPAGMNQIFFRTRWVAPKP